MANVAKKTGNTLGSILDLVGVIPDMGVRVIHQLDRGISIIDVKSADMLKDVTETSRINALTRTDRLVEEAALEHCERQRELFRKVRPNEIYDLAANFDLTVSRFKAEITA